MTTSPPAKPRLFVGSSSESLEVSYALQECLERDAEVTVWTQGIFQLSKSALQSLVSALDDFDFAVFVFAPNDVLQLRGETYSAVRDNVIFELGLFVGSLGEERAFILIPHACEDLRLPTDLIGVTPATYDANRRDRNFVAALGPAATRLRRAMSDAGLRPTADSRALTVSAPVAAGFSEELRSEVQGMLRDQERRINDAFERLERRVAAVLTSQRQSAKAPSSRITSVVREELSPRAQALLGELANSGHLTLEEYDQLAAGILRDAIEELRGHALLVPLRGYAPDGSRIPVYWLSPELPKAVRKVAKELTGADSPFRDEIRTALTNVGYRLARSLPNER